MRCLSETEVEKLLTYVQEKADTARRRGSTRAVIDEAIVLLLLNAGLRVNELSRLLIADMVTEQHKSTLSVRDSSGNVSRAVEITSEVASRVRTFVELHRTDATSDKPLIANEQGRRLAYISIFSKIKRIGRQAGLGNLQPRILRSTYVVRLYESTQNLRFVQEQAGHASPRTTAMYAMAAKDRDSQTAPIGARVPETATKANSRWKQVTVEKRNAWRTRENSEAVVNKSLQRGGQCEACGKQIAAGRGTRIDSGQILCPECLVDLRGA